MLELRDFDKKDGDRVVTWFSDEVAFQKWAAGTYDKFPITSEDMISRYEKLRSEHPDGFYPMVLCDDGEVVGHFIIRAIDTGQGIYRFGYIIVDSSRRGRGYGKRMLTMGLEFAFSKLGAGKVTLGVFENNPSAYACYKSLGFKHSTSAADTTYRIFGEEWLCLELEIKKEDI